MEGILLLTHQFCLPAIGHRLCSSCPASPRAHDRPPHPDAQEQMKASKAAKRPTSSFISRAAVMTLLVFFRGDELSGTVRHPTTPECKSQEVSCLRKTINTKYQDYRLPHSQIPPAHICLSQQFMLSRCQAVQIPSVFPKRADSWFLALFVPFAVRTRAIGSNAPSEVLMRREDR